MSDYPFLFDLAESRLIPSRSCLKQWQPSKLAELCYLYFIGLRILLANSATKSWARQYCRDTGIANDFESWRTNGNDLYVMLHAITQDADNKLAPRMIRHWLRHIATHDDEDDTRRLFMRLDGMFDVSNSAMRSLRRTVLDWDRVDARERKTVITKLIQLIHARAPSNSELLPHLSVQESASAGATGAASVATSIGGLGAGFDAGGQWRSIYQMQAAKKDRKKPILLRR